MGGDSGSDTSSTSDDAWVEGVEHILDQRTYRLSKSSWDASLLAGHSLFGCFGAVLMTLGFLVNALLQACFVYIVRQETFWNSLLFHPEDARQWRVHYGHSISNADPLTRESLVSRVCRKDGSLFVSQAQSMMKLLWDKYEANHQGHMLATGAVVVFGLSIAAELQSTIDFVGGVWGVPRGRNTSFQFVDGKLSLTSISTFRVVQGCVIGLVRCIIALVLFRFGSWWLVRTLDVEVLLLNAVALSFVTGIDEMTYVLFSSRQLDNVLEELEPLPCKQITYTSGSLRVPVWKACKMSLLLALGTYFVSYELNKIIEHHRKINRELCDGNRDFLWGFDPVGSLYSAKVATTASAEVHSLTDLYEAVMTNISNARLNLTREAIKFAANSSQWTRNEHLTTLEFTTLQHLERRTKTDVEAMASSMAFCLDSEINFSRAMFISTGNQGVKNCSGAYKYCNLDISYATRLYCPETCGCSSPISGLVHREAAAGCPTVCQQSQSYQDVLRELPCEDWSLEKLQADKNWARLLSGFRVMVAQLEQPLSSKWTNAWSKKGLFKLDCPGLFDLLVDWSPLFSEPNWKLGRPLEFVCRAGLVAFCPETCWCTNETKQAEWKNLSHHMATDMFEQQCPHSCRRQAL